MNLQRVPEQLVEVTELSNGNLQISLIATRKDGILQIYTSELTAMEKFRDLLAYQSVIGTWDVVCSDQTGDLISDTCPMIIKNPTDGLFTFEALWYYANYAIKDEIKELLTNGEVIFQKA